jgi:hypothetical protein
VRAGASREVRGAAAAAQTFSGRARAAQPIVINGSAGGVGGPHGRLRVMVSFTVTSGKVTIDLLADQERLGQFDLIDPSVSLVLASGYSSGQAGTGASVYAGCSSSRMTLIQPVS